MIDTKYKVIIGTAALAVSFAVGRFTVPKSVAKSTESSKEEQVNKNTHVQTTTTTVKSPDGEVKTVVTTDTTTSVDKTKKEEASTKTEVKAAGSKINVALLGGYNINHPDGINLGLSASKEVLGPVTAGIWGMKDGTIGLSIGLNF